MNIVLSFVHEDWVNSLITAGVILLATFIVSRITVGFMRGVLKKTTLLPSSSIFLNIIRVAVWFVGIASVLSICMNVNVSGMVTGLGVVGIAISLGFQDTLSNLIGGLQVSLSRSIEPGDRIRMGTSTSTAICGLVKDVTWRYTVVVDSSGNIINIPNSTMTSTAVTKLSPATDISLLLVVTAQNKRLTEIAHDIEAAASKAVARVSKLKKMPSVSFTGMTDLGFTGTLTFSISDDSKVTNATDAAIRAIAPYVHAGMPEAPSSLRSAPSQAASTLGNEPSQAVSNLGAPTASSRGDPSETASDTTTNITATTSSELSQAETTSAPSQAADGVEAVPSQTAHNAK